MAFEFLIVGVEVFHRGDNALALHAFNVGHTHLRGEVGILAVALKVPPPQRDALDVNRWAENHVAANRSHFLANRLTYALRHRRIPGGGDRYSSGKGSATEWVRSRFRDLPRARPRSNAPRPVRHPDRWKSPPRNCDTLHPVRPGQQAGFFL